MAGMMLNKNLREAREQAKVVGKFSQPLCELYRQVMKVSESDWVKSGIKFFDLKLFCQKVGLIPKIISPFELQAAFEDAAEIDNSEGNGIMAYSEIADCLIQCVRTNSEDWQQTSTILEDAMGSVK